MKKIAALASTALVVAATASPAFAADTPPDLTTLLTGVSYSSAIAAMLAAGGLVGTLYAAGTGIKWALKFLKA